MRLGVALGAAMVLLGAAKVSAQEMFPDIEYVAGKTGFADKIKGQLMLSDTAVIFLNKQGSPVFSIPVSTIKEVSQTVQEDPGSTGRKLLLGVFANRREEYVYLTTETATGAEGIVFKTKKNVSLGIITKIKFLAHRSGTAAPADSTHH